jgi:cob(I)alamin adenosyltransferase
MKIYTKTGDLGETSLFGGKRVFKDDPRVDAYGTVDELNAFVGLLIDALEDQPATYQLLIEVQRRLFSLGAHLAADPNGSFKMEHDLLDSDLVLLEQAMDTMDEVLPELRNFILPNGHSIVSICHVCRTVSRRAERSVVALQHESPVDPIALQYLNRLSDYFFVLSRFLGKNLGANEVIWTKRPV